jgi:hypothetical protein
LCVNRRRSGQKKSDPEECEFCAFIHDVFARVGCGDLWSDDV